MYCKTLWIKASAECPKCKCYTLNSHVQASHSTNLATGVVIDRTKITCRNQRLVTPTTCPFDFSPELIGLSESNRALLKSTGLCVAPFPFCEGRRANAEAKWTAFILRFSNQWPLEALYITAKQSPNYSHTEGGVGPRKATASSSGAVRVRCLARGHFDTPR